MGATLIEWWWLDIIAMLEEAFDVYDNGFRQRRILQHTGFVAQSAVNKLGAVRDIVTPCQQGESVGRLDNHQVANRAFDVLPVQAAQTERLRIELDMAPAGVVAGADDADAALGNLGAE